MLRLALLSYQYWGAFTFSVATTEGESLISFYISVYIIQVGRTSVHMEK